MVHANHPPSHRSKQRGGEGVREIKPPSQPPAHLDPTTLSNAYKHVKTMRKTMDYFLPTDPWEKNERWLWRSALLYNYDGVVLYQRNTWHAHVFMRMAACYSKPRTVCRSKARWIEDDDAYLHVLIVHPPCRRCKRIMRTEFMQSANGGIVFGTEQTRCHGHCWMASCGVAHKRWRGKRFVDGKGTEKGGSRNISKLGRVWRERERSS